MLLAFYFAVSVGAYLDNDYYYSAEDATLTQESKTVSTTEQPDKNTELDVDYNSNPELNTELTKTSLSTSLHNNAFSDNILNPLFTRGNNSSLARNAATIIQKSTDVQKLQSHSIGQQTSVTATNQSQKAENARTPMTAYELFYNSENVGNEFPIEKYFEDLNNVNSSDELLSVEDIFKSSKNTNHIDSDREVISTSEIDVTVDTSTVSTQHEEKNIRDQRIKQILEKLQANETLSSERFIQYYAENKNNQTNYNVSRYNDSTEASNIESTFMTTESIVGFENNSEILKTQDTMTMATQTLGIYKDNITYNKDNVITQTQDNDQFILNKDYLDDIIASEEPEIITDLMVDQLQESGRNKADDTYSELSAKVEIDPDMYDYEAHSKEIDSTSRSLLFSVNIGTVTEKLLPLFTGESTTLSIADDKLLEQNPYTDDSIVLSSSEPALIHHSDQEFATVVSSAATETFEASQSSQEIIQNGDKVATTDGQVTKTNFSVENEELSSRFGARKLDDSFNFRYNTVDRNGNICFRVHFKGTIQVKVKFVILFF